LDIKNQEKIIWENFEKIVFLFSIENEITYLEIKNGKKM